MLEKTRPSTHHTQAISLDDTFPLFLGTATRTWSLRCSYVRMGHMRKAVNKSVHRPNLQAGGYTNLTTTFNPPILMTLFYLHKPVGVVARQWAQISHLYK
jgi:hypothetical protein